MKHLSVFQQKVALCRMLQVAVVVDCVMKGKLVWRMRNVFIGTANNSIVCM